jgi:signal transduction histidine kinase/phage shock protein PspC (stress-responsive transcriptional regulator)
MPVPPSVSVPRRDDGRIVAGVAAGLGAHFGIEANLVRLGFIVLSLAGGFGVLLYGVGWILMPAPAASEGPPRRAPDLVQAGALAAVVLGLLLLARAGGAWFGDAIVWPLAAAALGLALLWMQPRRAHDRPEAPGPALDRLPPAAAQAVVVLVGTRRGAYVRVAIGALLTAGGIAVLAATAGSWPALRAGLAAAVIVTAGLALLVGPGLWRLASALVEERRDRIRSDERADMAAHLHDSVLQTLALVQRRADDPREVVRLARIQERELRAWLLSGDPSAVGRGRDVERDADSSLGTALEEAAAIVESEYGVPIDVVRVRDCALAGLEPLLLAAKEGMLNAARHSGAPEVSVFLEVNDDDAVVFVRDRGRGFDPARIGEDRGGLAASVVGRLARNGGRARVHTASGEGCELELTMPRREHHDV